MMLHSLCGSGLVKANPRLVPEVSRVSPKLLCLAIVNPPGSQLQMTQKKVLQDHKRQGKILIPPFTSMLGPLQEVSRVKTIMPELIWIALIQDSHGHREGVQLITSIARVARELMPPETPRIFCAVSSFVELT